ncbi:quorum-sensing sensor histidine kinase AgrC [Staphylococcus massiliensis]|uniref:quorum-sensing sensor histidine kinase AgrC n=1 Tax=Staphylococcus massiliensis TaxID=555791 RepID=UPI003BAE1BD1
MAVLSTFLLALFQAAILFIVANIILSIDYSRRDYISIVLGVIVPSTILFIFLKQYTLILLIVLFIIFFYKRASIIGVISALSSILILYLSNVLTVVLTVEFEEYFHVKWLSYIMYGFCYLTMSIVLAFLIRFIIYKFKASILYINKYYLFAMCFLLAITIFLIYRFMPDTVSTIEQFDNITFVFLGFIIIMLVIIVIITINVVRELKYRHYKEELETYYKYTLKIESVNNDMRKFRHDYINILATLSDFIREDDMEGLRDYFNNHISPLQDSFQQKNFKLNGVENLQVRGIKGLLTTKVLQAQEKDIQISVEVADPIDYINMNMVDLSRILGIIMDNAIEASEQIKKPIIQIAFIKTDSSIIIIVMNKCSSDTPRVHQLFKKDFSTKGKNRGVGLYTLKEITDSTSNVLLDTTIEGQYFIQKLDILNEDV